MQGLRRQTQGGASKSQWTKSDEGTSVEMRQQGAGERELLGEGETKETAAFLKTWCVLWYLFGFPRGARGKEPICQCRRHKRCGFDPSVRKIPWRRKWQPTLVHLPRESYGQISLAGYSP